MRLITDGEQFGVATDAGDAELARATKDAFDAGLTFLNHIRRDGECDDCGDEARLREIAVEGGDGGLVPASVCAECQARKMRALLEADDVG